MRSFLLLAMQLQQTCFALSAAFLLLAMQLQQACLILSAIHKKTVVLCERGSHPILPRCDMR